MVGYMSKVVAICGQYKSPIVQNVLHCVSSITCNIPGPVKHTYTLWFIHSPVLHCMCPYIEAQRVNL